MVLVPPEMIRSFYYLSRESWCRAETADCLPDPMPCTGDCELLFVSKTGSNKANLVNEKDHTTHWTDSTASELHKIALKFACCLGSVHHKQWLRRETLGS